MSITLDRFIHVLYNQSLSGIVNYSSVSYARVSRRSSVFCRRPTVGLILLTTLRARCPCNRILCAYTCDYSYLRKITNETNFFPSDKSVAYLPASLFSKHHLSFCCIFFLPFPLTHPHPKQIHTHDCIAFPAVCYYTFYTYIHSNVPVRCNLSSLVSTELRFICNH